MLVMSAADAAHTALAVPLQPQSRRLLLWGSSRVTFFFRCGKNRISICFLKYAPRCMLVILVTYSSHLCEVNLGVQ